MNHTLGPNMPLLRATVSDGFLHLISEPRRMQLDVQLPIEGHAYHADRAKPDAADYESLLEPTVIVKLSEVSNPCR